MSGLAIGQAERRGLTIKLNLASDSVTVAAVMTETAAEKLVADVLMLLAQMNPPKWNGVFEDVRDIRRAP